MNIKAIIIGLVALGVAGGGAYLITKDDDGQDSNGSTGTNQSLGGNQSINDLLASGQNIQCSYTYDDDSGNSSSGTTYIAGDQMRGSFSVQTSQGVQNSNVLRDDTYQYVWQDGSKTGFKTKVSSVESNDDQYEDKQKQESIDQDKKYDFDCTKWSVDKTVFKAPANVSFTDYSKQLEQSQELQDSVRDQQEAACKNLSGEARDACENAL